MIQDEKKRLKAMHTANAVQEHLFRKGFEFCGGYKGLKLDTRETVNVYCKNGVTVTIVKEIPCQPSKKSRKR